MPTKPTELKTPVRLEVKSVEGAIAILANNYQKLGVVKTESMQRCMDANPTGFVKCLLVDIEKQLSAQGIDWRTWEPPQPFKIGSHETTFNPDGSIKVGCTDIDRATLVEVLKRSDEAMKGEAEWPKYYLNRSGIVYRCTSHSDNGQYFEGDTWKQSCPGPLVEHAKINSHCWKPIPRAEASAILGREV